MPNRLIGFLDSLLRDLCAALRSVRRRPGVSIVLLLTLTLGIGLHTAIITAVDAILLRPPPLPNAARLFELWVRGGAIQRIWCPDGHRCLYPFHRYACFQTWNGALLRWDCNRDRPGLERPSSDQRTSIRDQGARSRCVRRDTPLPRRRRGRVGMDASASRSKDRSDGGSAVRIEEWTSMPTIYPAPTSPTTSSSAARNRSQSPSLNTIGGLILITL